MIISGKKKTLNQRKIDRFLLKFGQKNPTKSAVFTDCFFGEVSAKMSAKFPRNRPIFPWICPWKSRNLRSIAAWRRKVIKEVEDRKPARRLGWEQKLVLDKTATLRGLKILRNLTFFSRPNRRLEKSSAIHSYSLRTYNNWNNWKVWKVKFISVSIRSNMTGQHDWQEERSTPQSVRTLSVDRPIFWALPLPTPFINKWYSFHTLV